MLSLIRQFRNAWKLYRWLGLQVEKCLATSIFIAVKRFQTQFTGWLHSDDQSKAVSDLVNDFFLPAWINNQPNELNEVLSPIVLEALNGALTGSNAGNEPGEGSVVSVIIDHCMSTD